MKSTDGIAGVVKNLTATMMLLMLPALGPVDAWAQTAEVRLVALPSASASDSAAVLPSSVPRFLYDDSFVVEVWAQTTSPSGLSSVSADLTFTNSLATITGITHSGLFNVLTAGTVSNGTGTVDNLSGSHLGPCSDAVGSAPNWARVAILGVTATGSGSLVLQSGPTGTPIYGTAICGVGNIADAQIVFGSASVQHVDCLGDTDCGDGQFCNGEETCNLSTFTCQAGTAPSCDDGHACTTDACDPLGGGGTGACVSTPNDVLCDDGLFCTGVEFCDVLQGCLGGAAPCTGECEHCDETADACAWCVFDLDESGVMGTGDFSLFAPCFGGCHALGSACRESNFDGDTEGCVGTSDFAAFVGCFGSDCAGCAGCSGPGVGALAAGRSDGGASEAVHVRVIARRRASLSDAADVAPASDLLFAVGEDVVIEIWARSVAADQAAAGALAAGYVDVHFDSRRFERVGVIPSETFGLFADEHQMRSRGLLTNVGGCVRLDRLTSTGGTGWLRISSVLVRALQPGRTVISAAPADALHGFSRQGEFEIIDPSRLVYEDSAVWITRAAFTPGKRRPGTVRAHSP